MSIAIKVKNISKQYRLGEIGTGALSHDINRFWYKLRGKEDPYARIDHSVTQNLDKYIWALKDVDFEVNKGEVLGIIGKNGAGKSTLLKIISKITKPTSGQIKINGRIASLLEIGTGFHPEMTGRENIFMNGAILGMTRKEIQKKFDEIVDFSGVEKYIDTPVKRYSSGMYVRLAFAVSAHLEPDILIVDEVLAVGDAEFQKKCLGKMKDVNEKDGRTVLFVSHNMFSVAKLCDRVICLANGNLIMNGTPNKIIPQYLKYNHIQNKTTNSNYTLKNSKIEIQDFHFLQNGNVLQTIRQGYPLFCCFNLVNPTEEDFEFNFTISFKTIEGEYATQFGNFFQNMDIRIGAFEKKKIKIDLGELHMRIGDYYASLEFYLKSKIQYISQTFDEALEITVERPGPIYHANPDKKWKLFPQNIENGFVALPIFQITEEKY